MTMSYIPSHIVDDFFNQNDEYRKYFIKKAADYLLVDFTVLSIVLSFFFTRLTIISMIACITLFFLAIQTKWYIISRKLREFVIPIKQFWEKYKEIEKEAGELPDEEKKEYIKKESNEVYYATKKDAAIDTHDYYVKLMSKLNRYISFSFFCIIIVLFNIGIYGLFNENITNIMFQIFFDLVITFIFFIAIIFGFNIFSSIRHFIKNSKGIFKNKIKKKDRQDG